MYQDKQLTFSAAQEETTAASYISDNVVDLTHIPQNIIDNMFFVFRIKAAIVSAGGGTISITLVTSAAVGLGTNQILWGSGVIGNTIAVAWTANSIVYAVRVPPVMLLRYMGVAYVIGTADLTAGTWDAFLTPDAPFLIAATP